MFVCWELRWIFSVASMIGGWRCAFRNSLYNIQVRSNGAWAVGEVDFWIVWIFNFLQFAIDWISNSKTKVEEVFFFIFMSSYAEMSFLK
jgi:hypothetical protein